MSKWHYDYEEEIICKSKDDPRAGKYMAYEKDLYYQILNDKTGAFGNDEFDERDYLLDCRDLILLSYDEKYVFVPDVDVIEQHRIKDLEFDADLT